jgi:hypothetical protein
MEPNRMWKETVLVIILLLYQIPEKDHLMVEIIYFGTVSEVSDHHGRRAWWTRAAYITENNKQRERIPAPYGFLFFPFPPPGCLSIQDCDT